MTDRPILFSGEMVRAILERRKTQTRRVVKITNRTPGLAACLEPVDPSWARPKVAAVLCPYGQSGDLLWVRETWAKTRVAQEASGMDWVVFREDDNRTDYGGPWKPGIHLRRADARITLEITGVRVERLQDISEADAIAEGADCLKTADCTSAERDLLDLPLFDDANPHRNGYALLWDSINGVGAWDANPWVWVIEFRPHLVNIKTFIERRPAQ